jgi:heme/copper-type cytochrome/quinol oxidase subunit 2
MIKFLLEPVTSGKPIDPCLIAGCTTKVTAGQSSSQQILTDIILQVANILVFVTGSVAVLFIVYAAFRMVTSNGDSKKYEDGIKTIQYVVIGLFIAALSYGLVAITISIIAGWK